MLSLGVAGSLGADLIGALAPAVEAAGFGALWVNDTPDGDALAALAAAGRATTRLRLAAGVIPLDRRPAASLVHDLADSDIDPERLILGIGSGAARAGALDRVAAGIDVLRGATAARLYVGALGPRMRRLAAERADGVLLNWVTTQEAMRQRARLRELSTSVGVAVYVRTALDPTAAPRLRAETARYAGYPNYAAHFARMDVAAADTTLDGAVAAGRSIPTYRAAVDEVVLRAITPGDRLEDYLAFVEGVPRG
jgi:alkanesulfonate monooxygenase SsuD/methylene tetrahydromethanopterin reductase-like flavin-dependent oxidoreductase (luciferase family)